MKSSSTPSAASQRSGAGVRPEADGERDAEHQRGGDRLRATLAATCPARTRCRRRPSSGTGR